MYAELHARSAFSFLEGASLPEDIIGHAEQLGMEAVALLDRDNVSGAVRFHKAAEKAKLKAIIGAEITAAEGFRYPLIAATRTGYQNLCRLISKVKMNRQPGTTIEDIRMYSNGLVCLSGGVGLAFEELIDIFGKQNVYAEVQRHFHRDQEVRNQRTIEEAHRLKIPLLATNGVNHTTPQERELMDVLTCVRHKTTVHEAGRLLSRNAECHLKSEREMKRLFADLPGAIETSQELVNRVEFTLANLGYEFPRYPVPTGEAMNSFLRKQVEKRAPDRFDSYGQRERDQLEKELALIEKLDLAGYFLIVWDIVEFCQGEGILVQGRGSAANSAVCFALGITAINPIKMDLLFERFLSEERGEWPDIDLDLPSGDEREKAIQHIYKQYGKLGAAMTANVITYCPRSAVRDVGKALGFDLETLKRISSRGVRGGFEHDQQHQNPSSAQAQFRQASVDLSDPRIAKLFQLTQAVLDLPRHLGQHSGGMVICQGQLDSIVPLQPATMKDRVIVQWDKDDCADMGIVKVDLLGLGMLAVMKDTIGLICDHYHKEVDLARLPENDKKVYSALQKADTIGVFQVESRAQMSCLPRLYPRNFYDIVVQVAIIRPGPIVGNMMNPYLRRRQGDEDPVCLHPLLEPVLARTLGVPLFQEQLLRMAMIVADFTGGEAEELRRAIGYKRSQRRMSEIEVRLRERMAKKEITGEVQDTIVQSITAFALYGFPESHAASFALLAYASAYLKCHYLAAFTAAMLNNQPMGFYNSLTLIKDAQRHGLHFKPVDVTKSAWLCTIEEHNGDKWVRLGFKYIKGFRKPTGEAIEKERVKRSFENIDDLARRVDISKEEMNSLAELGALNFIDAEKHRREALWHAGLAIRRAPKLLAGAAAAEIPSPLLPMTNTERLTADFRNSGLSIGKHPMVWYRAELHRRNVLTADKLKDLPNGRAVRVAGAVICRQQPATAKGFVFLSLEDETGISNIILRPDLFRSARPTVIEESYLLIEGTLQNQFGVVSVKAQRILGLKALDAVVKSHDFC